METLGNLTCTVLTSDENSALATFASVLYVCSVTYKADEICLQCKPWFNTKGIVITAAATFCKIAEGWVLGPTEVTLKFLSVASNMLHKVSLQAMTAAQSRA